MDSQLFIEQTLRYDCNIIWFRILHLTGTEGVFLLLDVPFRPFERLCEQVKVVLWGLRRRDSCIVGLLCSSWS